MAHPNRYEQLIEHIFFTYYKDGDTSVEFARDAIEMAARKMKIKLPKNLGDLIYSFRYRTELPKKIAACAPAGKQWIIRASGRSRYTFFAAQLTRIAPNPQLAQTKVPDATPGIIAKYALSDEQALLAKLRYNRLIDVFTGVTCYSLQSHLRTTAPNIGQVETDEIYIGIDKRGAHFVFPVQAKGGRDKINAVQIEQDFAMCAAKFPNAICRPLAAQFMADDLIALFELEQPQVAHLSIVISAERHYRLVAPDELSADEIKVYNQRPEG
ncbi:MAG TPA: endonuclease [Phycisphaerae bacterium]